METIKRTIQNLMQDKNMSRIRTHRKCWKYHKGESSNWSGAGFLKLGTTDIWGWITPRWHGSKESSCQCRGHGFNPWVGKSPGEGDGYPLQSSCLENHMERGTWWTTVPGATKSDTTKGLNNNINNSSFGIICPVCCKMMLQASLTSIH